jgi:2-desacetyl-2-hydroxyethyl bacteriochlorophyllide A dehydrogenase
MTESTTMRAARFTRPGEPLQVMDVPIPRPGPQEVLVRVRATGLCGSDVHIAVEGLTPVGFTPITLGHEPAGEVAEVGDGVTGWSPGDRVAVFTLQSCGHCEHCLRGAMQVCSTRRIAGIHLDGALAEYMVTPAESLVALPPQVSFDVGGILNDAVATPFHALVDRAQLRAGETIAVFGVGGLGLHAVELARFMGAARVLAVDVRTAPLERARDYGADTVINASTTDPVAAVLEATSGRGVDVAAEFVGLQKTISQAIDSLTTGGRAVIVGLGPDPVTGPPPTVFVRKEASIIGSYSATRTTVERLVALAASGALNLERSITHVYPLEEANEALRVLHTKDGDPLRVIVQPS